MVHSMKMKYNRLKKYGDSVLIDYDEILLYYPDYYKVMVNLKNEDFISKSDVDKEFEDNYMETETYKKLINVNDSEKVHQLMKFNKDLKYKYLRMMYNASKENAIKMCKLIDYIGHYPLTYPVPNEDEKDMEMEELFEKYDIIVRYRLDDDLDYPLINFDVVTRIVEKLETNLKDMNYIKDLTSTNEWMFVKKPKVSIEGQALEVRKALDIIESFPLSCAQKEGKSDREEGKMYLKRQHGNKINI